MSHPRLLALLLVAGSAVGASASAQEETSAERQARLDALEADFDAHSRRAVPRDAFQVLDAPALVTVAQAKTLRDEEYVLGIAIGEEAKAYPIGALGSSELFNDTVGGVPIAGSW